MIYDSSLPSNFNLRHSFPFMLHQKTQKNEVHSETVNKPTIFT